jgi:hypothetical protein
MSSIEHSNYANGYDKMPRKKAQADDTGDASAQSNASANASTSSQANATSASQTGTGPKKRTFVLLLAAIAVILVIIIVFVYYGYTSLTQGKQQTGTQILNNISNSSLNQTDTLFINDIKKSEGVSTLHVTYYSSNKTIYAPSPTGNYTLAVSNNQTVSSYKMGNYNRTDINIVQGYTDTKTGIVLLQNVSGLEYYNTNATIICFNETTYSSGILTNSSLQCQKGDDGQSYVEEYPFTADNISSLSVLVLEGSIRYAGQQTIIGRSCDEFDYSNATSPNPLSNYTEMDMCLDTQYGIPLYLNTTFVSGGIPNSTAYTATSFTTNVSASELAIPQAYLSNVSQSII